MEHLRRALAVGTALLAASLCLEGCGGGPDDPGDAPADIVSRGLKSVSYGPLYLADQSCIGTYSPKCSLGFSTDDLAAPWAAPLWSDAGRGDLANLHTLGANAVRLYGNDPRFDKRPFLDNALSRGLLVVEGLSSYWYNGNGGPLCAMKAGANCHDTIRDAYDQHLRNGFVVGKQYHKALAVVNVMNEPDFLGEQGGVHTYLAAMVSGLDGMLTAEQQVGVKPWKDGRLPRFTISWSFATQALGLNVCDAAHFIHDTATECGPAILFMVQFYRVIHDPQGTVGYVPKNDLVKAYTERWVNSFNTFVDAEEVFAQFIKPYMALDMFRGVHAFLGEWHPPQLQGEDLEANLRQLATYSQSNETSLFLGASFFQYQVAYNKEGAERAFGMFNLGGKVIGATGYIEGETAVSHPVNCLSPGPLVQPVAGAFGGTVPTQGVCRGSAGSLLPALSNSSNLGAVATLSNSSNLSAVATLII